ncbi:MAG: hypothetical protein ACREXW_03210 [Gammaproteobacteria bacterium]
MTKRAPGLQRERLYRVLIHHLGSASPVYLVVALLFLMSFSWATDMVYEIGEDILGSSMRWSAFGLFIILVLTFILAARKTAARFRPRVIEDNSPTQVRGLILFLSVIGTEYGKQIKEVVSTGLTLDSFRQSFGRLAWRMPVEAIAYHRSRLRHVVVITSHHRDNHPGSHEQLALFRDLVRALFPGDLEVLDLSACGTGQTAGLDFEQDIDGLTQATDNAFRLLTEGRRLRPADILIDVTGGTKPSTIAGASVALAEGRRVQYVSTSDYRIRTYDVTYEPET